MTMRSDKLLLVETFTFKDTGKVNDINHHRLQRRPYLKVKTYTVVIFGSLKITSIEMTR